MARPGVTLLPTVTVLDGGMGRELLRIGAPFRQPEWSALALWEAPERVIEAHRNFIAAGAQVITTNSYAVVPFHIGDARFHSEGRRLAAVSGELARSAVDAGSDVTVAGSLPPLFGSYQPDLFDAAAAAAIIDPLVDGLAPSIDVWLGETLGSIDEAHAVRGALDRSADARPLWLSFTLAPGSTARLRSGERVDDAARAASDLGADALLFNCCHTDTIAAALDAASAVTSLRLGAYANRFADDHDTGSADAPAANSGMSQLRADVSPADYAALASRWRNHGASIIGGCCGIEPAHIAALAAALR
jgi:S-methylmethionine-dependent homocysteine/selenocysteine methylase